jgi:RNA polymerase sigma-70 factor (ECF subfamily)
MGQVELMQRLHDEHATALWGYSMRLTGNDRARAEDVVQETLLRAWRHISVLEDSQGSARAWLFTVARNIVIDEWRTKRSHLEFAVAEVPEVASQNDRTEQLLQSWMVRTPSRPARVLLPRRLGGRGREAPRGP